MKDRRNHENKIFVGSVVYDDQLNTANMIIFVEDNPGDLQITVTQTNSHGLIQASWINAARAFIQIDPREGIHSPGSTVSVVTPDLPQDMTAVNAGASIFHYPHTEEQQSKNRIRPDHTNNRADQIIHGSVKLAFHENTSRLRRLIMGRFSLIPVRSLNFPKKTTNTKLTRYNFMKLIEGLTILLHFENTFPVYQSFLTAHQTGISTQHPVTESGVATPYPQPCLSYPMPEVHNPLETVQEGILIYNHSGIYIQLPQGIIPVQHLIGQPLFFAPPPLYCKPFQDSPYPPHGGGPGGSAGMSY